MQQSELEQARIKLEKDIAEFKAKGGKIDEIESYKDSDNNSAFPSASIGNNLY